MRQIIGSVNTVTYTEKTSAYAFKMCRSSVITLYEVLYTSHFPLTSIGQVPFNCFQACSDKVLDNNWEKTY